MGIPEGMGSSAGDMASPGLPLDGSVVKMKGLPFKASCEDVLKFYGGFSIKTSSIYLKRHPDGRPSGEVRILRCSWQFYQHGWHAGTLDGPSGLCMPGHTRTWPSQPRPPGADACTLS